MLFGSFAFWIIWIGYHSIVRAADWQISGMNEEVGVVTLEKWWGLDEEIARARWSDKDETWYYEDPETGEKQRFTTDPPDYADYDMSDR